MKEIYYTYNNEAIGSCVLFMALLRCKKLDIARAFLILPFMLDDKTLGRLESHFRPGMNLRNLIKEQPEFVMTFRKRYLSLMPISINSLVLMQKMDLIDFSEVIAPKLGASIESAGLGERLSRIEAALPILLATIDEYSTAELYQILKIEL